MIDRARYQGSLNLNRLTDIKPGINSCWCSFSWSVLCFPSYHLFIKLVNPIEVFLNILETKTQINIKCFLLKGMPIHKIQPLQSWSFSIRYHTNSTQKFYFYRFWENWVGLTPFYLFNIDCVCIFSYIYIWRLFLLFICLLLLLGLLKVNIYYGKAIHEHKVV